MFSSNVAQVEISNGNLELDIDFTLRCTLIKPCQNTSSTQQFSYGI